MEEINLNLFKHKTSVRVRFMDIDALGHVNNARYLNFLEESRISYSQDVLNLFKKIEEFNILVARIEIDFKLPILFNESVDILTRVSKIGNKSFTFESLITIQKEDKTMIAARALQTLVLIEKSKGNSTPIPDWIRSDIKNFEVALE